jgi:hypothetical protein
MPIRPEEFHRAIAAVHDQASLNVAHAMTQNQEVDINSIGSDGKSALNHAFENLFTPLLKILNKEPLAHNEDPSKHAVQYKIKIIDTLCATSASLSALEHTDTVSLMSAVTAKAEKLMNQAKSNRRDIDSPTILSALIDMLPENEKVFLAAFYMFNEIIKMATIVEPLENKFREFVATRKFADIKNKLMLIFEHHGDIGTTLLLLNIRSKLLDYGYTTICMEWSMGLELEYVRSNIDVITLGNRQTPMNFLLSRNNEVFANNARFIDPRTSITGSFDNTALYYFSSRFMSPLLYTNITDKGLFFNLCQAVVDTDGKALAIIGVNHNNTIISKLKQFGIPYTVTVPFQNPTNLSLKEKSENNFEPTITKQDHPISLIFRKHGAMPLKMNPLPSKEVMEDFVKSRLAL